MNSLDEIKTKIAERESSIGFTDEIKSAGKFGWTDIELDSEYINGIEVHEVDFVDCEFDETAQEAYDTATKAEETSVEYLYIDSLDSFRWEGPLHLYIKDLDGKIYHLSDTTVVASGVPCNDDGCDPLLWAARYIDHCSITDDSDPNGPYYCQGFGGSDVWEIRADEKNNIKLVVDVFAVD